MVSSSLLLSLALPLATRLPRAHLFLYPAQGRLSQPTKPPGPKQQRTRLSILANARLPGLGNSPSKGKTRSRTSRFSLGAGLGLGVSSKARHSPKGEIHVCAPPSPELTLCTSSQTGPLLALLPARLCSLVATAAAPTRSSWTQDRFSPPTFAPQSLPLQAQVRPQPRRRRLQPRCWVAERQGFRLGLDVG